MRTSNSLATGHPYRRRVALACTGIAVLAVFVWSMIGPRDRVTWLLEVAPVLIAAPILLFTRRRFPLTTLSYVLIGIHAIILMIGGHYTYSEVPFFNWLRDEFGLGRNIYDRIGHLAQGFIPAILTREVLLRTSPLQPGKWLAFLVLCVCLAISATYELLEGATAHFVSPDSGNAFLGTQGDPWDTQWDMFLALAGAAIALACLSRVHDRFLRALAERSPHR